MQLGPLPTDTSPLRGEHALRFLAEASARLNRSLDVEETLGEITRMAVPSLADWCSLELGNDPRTSRLVAVAHVDPKKVQLAYDLRERFPPKPEAPNGVPAVLRTGNHEFVPMIPDAMLDASGPEQAKLARELGLKSYIVVPLKVRDRVLGALSLVTAESRRTLEQADLDLAMDLAGRAAIALDNARLYAEARDAETRSRLALEAGRLGTWEWDVAGQKVHWSAAIERMHGIPVGSFDGSFEMYQSDMHPDDKARVLGSVTKLLEGTELDHHLLYRIIRPDGAVRWLEAFGRLTRDPSGRPLSLRGVCGDVTDRVERERELEAANARTRASELRFQQILDSVKDLVFTRNEQLELTYLNKATADFVGNKPQVNQHDRVVFEKGEPIEETVQAKNAQGEPRFMHVVKSPVRDASGKIVELVGIARDVTEARQIEARERELEHERRASMQHSARVAVVEALSTEGEDRPVLQRTAEALLSGLHLERAVIWMVNPESRKLEVYGRAGAPGPMEPRSLDEGVLAEVLRTRMTYRSDSPETDPKGKELGVPPTAKMFALFPLVVGGEALGALSFSTAEKGEAEFITLANLAETVAQAMARRRAQTALASFAKELERSNADLQQFAYVASHDLQEPLRMVASYVQLLERRYKGKLDQDADDFIRFAVEGTRRMQSLINDLLAFSRVGTRAKEIKAVALDGVVRAALDNLQNAVERTEAEVKVNGALPKVLADGGQLTQVFQNLIGNALKFKRGAPHVEISSQTRGSQVEVTVKDDGIGIDPQYFDRVFVIFQRLHTRHEFEGNGIGLAISKKIVERHGGRIWIESTPGQGSTFHFTLPAEA